MLQIFKNKDKEFYDDDEKIDDVLFFSKPSKILIIGKSNSGKTNLVKNIINKNNFSLVYLFHIDEYTKEYNDVNHIKYKFDNDYIEVFCNSEYRNEKKIYIFDDIDFRNLKKDIKNHFYKLLSYGCTHCNLTVVFVCHDILFLPSEYRRQFDYVFLYRIPDETSKRTTFNSFSGVISKKNFIKIENEYMPRPYDFIMMDIKNQKAYLFNKDYYGGLIEI
jgi:GTPase SAR1 family protein